MKKEKTKRIILSLMAVLMLALFSCNVAEMPGAEQPSVMEERVQEGEVIYEEDTKSFVNGFDQAYLKERGITEEELIKEMEAELTQEEESVEAATRGVAFGFNGFFDINDMIANPSAYFTCNINNSGANSYVEVGVKRVKLNEMLSRIPEVQLKNTMTNRLWVRKFRLNEVTSNTIVVTSEFEYKKYLYYTKKIGVGRFKKRITIHKLIFKTKGNVTIALPYRFDAATQEIVLSDYKITKITGNKLVDWLGPLFTNSVLSRREFHQRIPFNFLPKEYLTFKFFYTTPEALFVRLECDKAVLTQVVHYARKMGFDQFTGEVPPLFSTGDMVKIGLLTFRRKIETFPPKIKTVAIEKYLTKDSHILNPNGELLSLTRLEKGKFTIGSLGIDSQNRLVMNSPYPAVWTVKILNGGRYTIQSGSNFLSLNTTNPYALTHSVTLSTNSFAWMIIK